MRTEGSRFRKDAFLKGDIIGKQKAKILIQHLYGNEIEIIEGTQYGTDLIGNDTILFEVETRLTREDGRNHFETAWNKKFKDGLSVLGRRSGKPGDLIVTNDSKDDMRFILVRSHIMTALTLKTKVLFHCYRGSDTRYLVPWADCEFYELNETNI